MDLPKVVSKSKKRRGQGYGSGKGGHTSGRGQKGQKSRTKIGILFEGMKVKKSMIKRLPLRRGKGKLKSHQKPIIVPIELLNFFPAGAMVDLKALIDKKLVNAQDALKFGVKVLGNGKLTVEKLRVVLPMSNNVRETLTKLGGKVGTEAPEEKNKKSSKQNKKK
ncbi:MAG TPA: uL15m family ribosomal protein [Patescibacteria group bacterium]|nr:uL15m family ribosomal protein [Patescibacteria group bacterium]